MCKNALEQLARLELAEQVFEHHQAPKRVELKAQARKERFFPALDGKLEETRVVHFEASVVYGEVG